MSVKPLRWWFGMLLAVAGVATADETVSDTAAAADADADFFEFLGSMGSDAEEWEEFMDISVDEVPMVAEADHE